MEIASFETKLGWITVKKRSSSVFSLSFGKTNKTKDIKNIDKVSKETVQKIANEVVKGPITISSIGPLSKLENIDKIQNRIN